MIVSGDEETERVSRHAIESQQTERIRIVPIIEYFVLDDSFSASRAACKLVENGVWSILNPYSNLESWVLKSIAERTNIPHLTSSWEHPYASRFFSHSNHQFNYTLNLHPGSKTMNKAITDYILFNSEWRSFTILYDTPPGLVRVRHALTIPTIQNSSKINDMFRMDMKVRRFNPTTKFEEIFKEMSRKRESNFVISLQDRGNLERILNGLKKFRLLDYYCSFFLLDLDIQFLTLSDSFLGAFNATAFRIFNPYQESYRFRYNPYYSPEDDPSSKHNGFKLTNNYALIYDAVSLFIGTISKLEEDPIVIRGPDFSCQNGTWQFGETVISRMRDLDEDAKEADRITGPLLFDSNGDRRDVRLELIRFQSGYWTEIGEWTHSKGIKIENAEESKLVPALDWLKTNKLKVIVAAAKPYVMKRNLTLKEEKGIEDDLQKYEGLCIDMLDYIQKNLSMAGFEVILFNKSRNKGGYGKIENGSWVGMLGEMLNNNYDLATTDLTITHERQTAVDFTTPFMTMGISILFTKPQPPPLNLWAFLDPFSLEVWFYVATAYIGVTMLMYYTARISPYEWISSHPCDEEPDFLNNQFSLGNCLWFTLGSIMQQGSDLAPKARSMRFIASSWSFFTLIMVSSYTANLAAFLTVARLELPINNAEDLALQTKVAYGCARGGSTSTFFANSTYTTYQRMYAAMVAAGPRVFTQDNDDGVRRVLKGNFAFLMESSSIVYQTNRYCNLTQVGDLLDQKGYGIALRPGSPYRTVFNQQIIRMKEQGVMTALKKKWLEEYPTTLRQNETGQHECPNYDDDSATNALDVANVGGVFIVLLIGMGISALFVVIEFVWRAKKYRQDEDSSTIVMFFKEVRNLFTGQSSSRPGWKKRPSSSEGTHSMSSETASKAANNKVIGDNRSSRKFLNSIGDSKSIITTKSR